MGKIEIIRWLFVGPIAVFGFYLSLFLGIALYSVLNYICPNDQMVSGVCTAPWFKTVVDALLILCPVLGAILVITLSFYIAPKYKTHISKLVYLIGCGIAFYFAYISSNWWAFLAVCLAGLMTVILINKRFAQFRFV